MHPELEKLWKHQDLDRLVRCLQRMGYGKPRRGVKLDIRGLSRLKTRRALDRWRRGQSLICPYCGETQVCCSGRLEDGWICTWCRATWTLEGEVHKLGG